MRRLAVVASALSLAACATIMHGTTQDVGFSSTPTSARVTVDNQSFGQTPTIAKLSRKDNHIVKIALDGYQPYETTLTRSTSGWVWGNIVFGGIPGLAIDAISGGLYKLNPEQVAGQMAAATQAGQSKPGNEQAMKGGKDAIYIAVVLRPDPSWRRIGTLTRESAGR